MSDGLRFIIIAAISIKNYILIGAALMISFGLSEIPYIATLIVTCLISLLESMIVCVTMEMLAER